MKYTVIGAEKFAHPKKRDAKQWRADIKRWRPDAPRPRTRDDNRGGTWYADYFDRDGIRQRRSTRTADVKVVIRALRSGPQTAAQISSSLELPLRKVHRLLTDLRELGAPIKEVEGDRVTETAKRAPLAYSITVDGLREWLG